MHTVLDAPLEAFDQRERSLVDNVRRHGWFCTGVGADTGKPSFSYSTGFWATTHQPEFIIFSLRFEIAHQILWDLFRNAQAGQKLPLGKHIDSVFANTVAYAFPLARRHYADHLGWSRWFYAGDNFPCAQIIWPDRGGAFPWEKLSMRPF